MWTSSPFVGTSIVVVQIQSISINFMRHFERNKTTQKPLKWRREASVNQGLSYFQVQFWYLVNVLYDVHFKKCTFINILALWSFLLLNNAFVILYSKQYVLPRHLSIQIQKVFQFQSLFLPMRSICSHSLFSYGWSVHTSVFDDSKLHFLVWKMFSALFIFFSNWFNINMLESY